MSLRGAKMRTLIEKKTVNGNYSVKVGKGGGSKRTGEDCPKNESMLTLCTILGTAHTVQLKEKPCKSVPKKARGAF